MLFQLLNYKLADQRIKILELLHDESRKNKGSFGWQGAPEDKLPA
jgi:hypothetical protein